MHPIPEPEKVAEILTDIGLEVEGLDKLDAVKGGLEGLVIGEVKSCEIHPNADKLSVTTVDTGGPGLLNIVCGAPNVALGQKVVVAPVGTTLYSGDDTFKIKKTKIRGELSEGMICAEDEIGLGSSHEGIIVLDENAVPGIPAKDYFDLEDDHVFEIGLTPNRIDAGSHYGVARDLAAFLNQDGKANLHLPPVDDFKVDNTNSPFKIIIENTEDCKRYAGVSIDGIEIAPSPGWLQKKIRSLGMNPINNVVDITNFVLHEVGQPLHAFDADKLASKKIIVKNLPDGSRFTTLDEVERKLSPEDLLVCDENGGVALAGVFGGLDSGVTANTKNIFLESAYFNPVSVRKTARRHGLNTDASFHFERGADPDITIYALKRATILIKEIAGGKISSEIIDNYPSPIQSFDVDILYSHVDRLIGKKIDRQKIKNILQSLEIEIVSETEHGLGLKVPPYRVDVQREADIIEEILRVYGYNNVEISEKLVSSLSHGEKPPKQKLQNLISDFLCARDFTEIMSNSLTPSAYYEGQKFFPEDNLVGMINPLSNDLNVLRQTLLFGGLEAIARNTNRQKQDLKLYEFGNIYQSDNKDRSTNQLDKYHEEKHLALYMTGNINLVNWMEQEKPANFFWLKSEVEAILNRFKITNEKIKTREVNNEIFSEGLELIKDNKILVSYGKVSMKVQQKFDIDKEVYYAEINWDNLLIQLKEHSLKFRELPKFPEVRRDLSLLLDKEVNYNEIEKISRESERKFLKNITLFDVYTGDRIEEGKKSYAIAFTLQDENKTLTDKQIDKIMQKISANLTKTLNAQVRQ